MFLYKLACTACYIGAIAFSVIVVLIAFAASGPLFGIGILIGVIVLRLGWGGNYR